MKRQVKVGVRAEAEPTGRYRWSAWYLTRAAEQARKWLDEVQYEHLVDQVRALAEEDDPTHTQALDVKPVEDFHELRERGGPLGSITVRVFFGIDKPRGSIVVLGVEKKKTQQTPDATKVKMRNRWRRYKRGDYGASDSNSTSATGAN